MGPVVLDTSILSAIADPADAHHDAVTAEIRASRAARQQICISSVTLAELHSVKGPERSERIAWADRFVHSLGAGGVVAVDRHVAELAGELRSRRPSLKLPDALIKGSADSIGAQLLTADRRLSRLDGVRYVGTKRR